MRVPRSIFGVRSALFPYFEGSRERMLPRYLEEVTEREGTHANAKISRTPAEMLHKKMSNVQGVLISTEIKYQMFSNIFHVLISFAICDYMVFTIFQ